jgi:integrase
MRHNHHLTYKFYPLFKKLAALHGAAAPARFKWHALRHFAVSCWIEAGASPKTVQTWAGHSTLAMTMDTYGHLFPSEDHSKTMNAIARGC